MEALQQDLTNSTRSLHLTEFMNENADHNVASVAANARSSGNVSGSSQSLAGKASSLGETLKAGAQKVWAFFMRHKAATIILILYILASIFIAPLMAVNIALIVAHITLYEFSDKYRNGFDRMCNFCTPSCLKDKPEEESASQQI